MFTINHFVNIIKSTKQKTTTIFCFPTTVTCNTTILLVIEVKKVWDRFLRYLVFKTHLAEQLLKLLKNKCILSRIPLMNSNISIFLISYLLVKKSINNCYL